MLLFSALVAGSFSLGGLAANELAPTALNFVRFAIAAAVLGGVALATIGLPHAAFRAPWRYLVLGGLFSIYFVTMFEGLKTAPPISSAAVFTLTPLMAAGFGFIIAGQRMTLRMGVALAIGAVGALWVIFRADWAAFMAFEIGRGEAIFFWGCIAHAAYIPMVARLNRGEAPMVFSFGTLVAGALLLLVYGWGDIVGADWMNLPSVVWVAVLYTAVAGSAITFVLVQYAALRLPAAKVMAYTYLVPSWVIGWEVALGQFVPSGFVLVGVAVTMAALLLLLKPE
ncbi:EamA-like transporter family protein [Aliiruegeria haliotis]|uniref:EamA-like transporter family protein n=2 Tax=Aliiruegeria haliotis TaxID=1280846 RepID=A0A2T0RL28_9RHOB|nr:EamA-like transporter family protein [Aliiruegeria haliotis]